MKILIDIGHPAHVHYFKNLIRLMGENGHKFIITARNKDITHKLLKNYNVDFINRGKGKNGTLGKLLYLIKGTFIIFRIAKKNKIDFFLSFASPYASIASFLCRKPSIILDDTEHNHFNHKIYSYFSSISLHPTDFKKRFGNKQLFFDGTMEDAYLHNFYVNTKPKEKRKILIRFVSWRASHDRNEFGFSEQEKEELINTLKTKGKIYISSESELPNKFKKYQLTIEPHTFHDFLLDLDLYVGESGSIATETSFLGIPSIVLNSASDQFGVFSRFKNLGLLYIAKNGQDAIKISVKFLEQKIKDNLIAKSLDYRQKTIDLNTFLVWFIENYPESVAIMKENPDYQYNFK